MIDHPRPLALTGLAAAEGLLEVLVALDVAHDFCRVAFQLPSLKPAARCEVTEEVDPSASVDIAIAHSFE